jgi:hypothetical protein
VAASSKLVGFRSGTRHDVLPAVVAMTGNHTGIDPQGVRIEVRHRSHNIAFQLAGDQPMSSIIQVGYYPEPILSTVETASLQDASRSVSVCAPPHIWVLIGALIR